MILGSMKDVFLTRAKEMFVFDCHVGGFEPHAVQAYRSALASFIRFTGNIQVRQLTPDHLELYIANLYDGPDVDDDHRGRVMSQYVMIQTWIHWMESQQSITERSSTIDRPVDLEQIFPPRAVYRLAHCE